MLNIVESKIGRILVSDKDQYLGRSFIEYGEFSQGEVDLFDRAISPEWIVADIGANFGAHTLFFASKARHVYAFEPQRMVYNALCGSLALNNIINVTPINAAVGAEDGVLGCTDLHPERINNIGGLSLCDLNPSIVSYNVPVVKFSEPVNFMKIDVEGMENDVIKGCADMITACKPVLYVENDRKDKSAQLIQTIHDLGYAAYWHMTPLFNPDNHFKNNTNVFEGLVSLNMLCVPKNCDIQGLPRVTEPYHPAFGYTL